MKTPKALKRAFDPSDKLEQHPQGRLEQISTPEPNPSSDLPYQAAPVTLLLSDMLARFDGVPRWGINE
jgi:hypothetical protein